MILGAELGSWVGKTTGASSCTTETPCMKTGEKQTNTKYFNIWIDTEYALFKLFDATDAPNIVILLWGTPNINAAVYTTIQKIVVNKT